MIGKTSEHDLENVKARDGSANFNFKPIFYLTILSFFILLNINSVSALETNETLFTVQVAKILLLIVFLIGIAASTGFFAIKMRNGDSVADIWKYFIIMVIWDVIFLTLFVVLSKYVMSVYYPA